MSPKLTNVVLVLLVPITMGQSTCLMTTDDSYEFAADRNATRRVSGEPVAWVGDSQDRLELWVNNVNSPREFEDESLGITIPGSRSARVSGLSQFENEWWSYPPPSAGEYMSLDPTLLIDDEISYAFLYREGECSMTIPWHIRDLDFQNAQLEDQIRANIHEGLFDVTLTGWDDGFAGAEGTYSQQNVAWFTDASAEVDPIPEERPTQLFVDPGSRWGRPNNRMCVASYFTTNTHLSWTADTAGNKSFVALGGIAIGLAKLFGLGDCRADRISKLTLCGKFDVVTEQEANSPLGGLDFDGEWIVNKSMHGPDAGDLTFRIGYVDVKVGSWGAIHFICNKNKYKIEEAIEEIVRQTAGASIGQLAEAFSGNLPFHFERCFITGEGLHCVIAEDSSDPDYAVANALGLCNYQRGWSRGILTRGGTTL